METVKRFIRSATWEGIAGSDGHVDQDDYGAGTGDVGRIIISCLPSLPLLIAPVLGSWRFTMTDF